MHSPILKVVAVASIGLVVMAGVMASGRAHETCVTSLGDESPTFGLDHRIGCGQPTTLLTGPTPS
jgi:hypothetical protein